MKKKILKNFFKFKKNDKRMLKKISNIKKHLRKFFSKKQKIIKELPELPTSESESDSMSLRRSVSVRSKSPSLRSIRSFKINRVNSLYSNPNNEFILSENKNIVFPENLKTVFFSDNGTNSDSESQTESFDKMKTEDINLYNKLHSKIFFDENNTDEYWSDESVHSWIKSTTDSTIDDIVTSYTKLKFFNELLNVKENEYYVIE